MKQSFVFYILSLMIVFSNSIAKDRKIETLTGPFITDSTYTSPQTLNMINPLQGEFQHIQQQGQSWSNDQIGINTGKYISTSGSAVTCLAMLYKAKGVNVDPGKLNTWLIENNGYAVGGLLKWDVAANYPESKIVWYGSSNYDLTILKSEIDAGNLVIANVTADGEQFVVIKSYDGNGTNAADFIVANPMNSDESKLSEYTVLGLRIYRNQIEGMAATLTVTNPRAGYTWNYGSKVKVEWDYSGLTGNISVDIYQGSNQPGYNRVRAVSSVPVSQRSVEIDLANLNYGVILNPANDYLVGISAVPSGDPWAFSNGFHSIRRLTITSPNGGQTFSPGQVINVQWNYDNVADFIGIDLYQGNTNYQRIANNIPNNNNANVTIPASTPLGSNYRIAISAHNGYVWDFSDNYFTIASPPQSTIYLSTNYLNSNCAQGTNASTQSFQVRNSGSGTLSYSINSNASWMYCSPSSGTSTGEYDNINVNYNTSGLGVGTYNGTITVSGSGATNNPQTINVSLVVTSAPRPAVSVTSLSNSCVFGTNATNQSFEVWNSGGGTLFYAISDNATSWLSCAPTGGTSTGERDYIAVNYSTSGLSVGTYNASIMVNGNGITETISVVLNVTQNPTISFNPASINITCKQDGFLFPTPLDIWNSGGGILSYTLNTNVSWLSFRLTSETLSGDHSDNSVFYNPEGLSVGTHNATITISAPGATNTPQTIPVTLIITPKPQISLNPANLNNSCAVGNIATSQSFEIWNSGGHTLEYNISTNVYWLSCLPPSGTSTGEHDIIQVNYFSSNLTPGTYNATITIGGNFDDVMIPVSLTVTQGATISRNPITLTNGCPLGSDAPSQNFEVWNSGNSTLTYTISDNVSWLSCTPTNGTSTGEHDNVTVNYSSAGLSAGTYNATITINASGATNSPQTIPVTLTISQSPIISLNTTTLNDSCLIGQNAPAQNFEVWN
ncbi:hypothetical protein JW964_25265, partial [candidate division KSB1 bacterium]|nr:hypothetical protein [candidate division KSB1 bacterium]